MPAQGAVDVGDIIRAIASRDHRLFPGKLVRQHLSFVKKALAIALRAPNGDFRDRSAIREWAGGITNQLQPG